MGSGIYKRGCPYCPSNVVPSHGNRHLREKHPDKPSASDTGFPGWRDQNIPFYKLEIDKVLLKCRL